METTGNYQAYYGYRSVDERSAWLRPLWFAHKKVLDVGCNDGRVLMHVAEALGCRSALGIDSDAQLVQKALAALDEKYQQIERFPYCGTTIKPLQTFPFNIDFRQEDFLIQEHDDYAYDVVTCFSVSKWIHLNYGDEGILKLFEKVRSILVDGGLFIFEYQGWPSYKKRKNLTSEIKANFQSIRIRPADFESLLQERFGFEVVDRRGPSATEAKGFDRPCLCLRKTPRDTIASNEVGDRDRTT